MPLTRRDFLATSAVATIAGTIGRSSLVRAWPPQTPGLILTDIRGRVGYCATGVGTIGYFIDARGGCVVVDTGNSAAMGKAFVGALNKKSDGATINRVINTHYHQDHTGGNAAFKGLTKKIIAHPRTIELHKTPPKDRQPPTGEQLPADSPVADVLREQVGPEWVRAKFYGPAHTGGDLVVTFEQANVAHLGDLVLNRRHPNTDPLSGMSLRNWSAVLDKVVADHNADTVYIFGHGAEKAPLTGNRADVMTMKNYLTTLVGFVGDQMKAGRTRDQIAAMTAPLKGFEGHGALTDRILKDTYDELTRK
jgi:glyoxylase-like metal-dependent hydrolase (beta-lactamase superfamily II)